MIQDAATSIALCEREHGIDTSVEECLNELKFGLVEVVYEWANGMVRVITLLDDLIYQYTLYSDICNLYCRSFWRLQN